MINKDLLDFIWTLSAKDTKTLSQKALKLAEETGELAKKVLPLENAFGTTHRFVRKIDILEEVADNFLVGLSIAQDLGFTPADVQDMISRKTLKWAGLQERESAAKWPCPFEIHVTVKHANTDHGRTLFQKACESIGVKPILIDAQTLDGETVFLDLQTSQVHLGTNPSAYRAMQETSAALAARGFEVVREKIETVPWHPAAPSKAHIDPVMPPNCYFESHVAVIIPESDGQRVQDLARRHEAHLSRNAFKRFPDGLVKLMVTYREHSLMREDFEEAVARLVADLTANSIAFEKPIVEFSIFDSKLSHDVSWISGKAA